MGRASTILVRWVAPILALVVVLGVAFVLFAPRLVSIEVVRRSMSREIAGWSGRSMTFEGTPEVAFTPFLTVTFPKARIESARDGTLLVDMDALRAQVPLLPLIFRGRIEPSAFTFRKPHFRVNRAADGTMNCNPALSNQDGDGVLGPNGAGTGTDGTGSGTTGGTTGGSGGNGAGTNGSGSSGSGANGTGSGGSGSGATDGNGGAGGMGGAGGSSPGPMTPDATPGTGGTMGGNGAGGSGAGSNTGGSSGPGAGGSGGSGGSTGGSSSGG